MLKKRLVGVVTVIEGLAVQSFGYNVHLPLGCPVNLVENLDRWGADEILVQSINRSKNQLGPDFSLLEKLSDLGIGTPFIYSGGVRNVGDAVDVISQGADRVAFDNLLQKNPSEVVKISDTLGAQALIASLPVVVKDNRLFVFDYIQNNLCELNKVVVDYIENRVISEVLLIDYLNEGFDQSFNEKILTFDPLSKANLILFGGISHRNR